MNQSLKMANRSMPSAPDRDKRSAALTTIAAALGLMALKLVVGLATNSLGLLAAAAHSGFGLVAGVVTLMALAAPGTPAGAACVDKRREARDLFASVGMLLLLIICGWIVGEALTRIFLQPAQIMPSTWAWVAVGACIVVDIACSRRLHRVAGKYSNSTLEADALHFRTEAWSSALVAAGLAGAALAARVPALSFLARADAVGALGIAVVVCCLSFQVGRRAAQALMHHAPRRAERF